MNAWQRFGLLTAMLTLAPACNGSSGETGSSTESGSSANANGSGQVLIIMSGVHELQLRDGKTYPTGYYLDELAQPLRKLLTAGYTPVFASPHGETPSIDQISIDKVFFNNDQNDVEQALELVKNNQDLQHPKTLEWIQDNGTDEYAGVFIPGGWAPTQDLIQDTTLGAILRTFHDTNRPTGVVCHGPVALLSTMPDPVAYRKALVDRDFATASELAAGWPYAGYHITVFSTAEEQMVEGTNGQLGGFTLFYPPDALAQAGAHVDRVALWQPNVVEDRELVSGQQPFSSDAVGDALVAKLNARQ